MYWCVCSQNGDDDDGPFFCYNNSNYNMYRSTRVHSRALCSHNAHNLAKDCYHYGLICVTFQLE